MTQRICLVGTLSAHLRASGIANGSYTSIKCPSCCARLFQRTLHTSFAADDQSARIVDVKDLAHQMRASVREYTKSLGTCPVKLLGILAHEGPYRSDSESYSLHIAETCLEDGIEYEQCRVLGEKPCDVEEAIRDGSARPDVNGILVYYPIFKKEHEHRGPYKNRLTGVYYKTYDDYLRDVVCHTKDVEGLCQEYNGRWLFRARGKEGTNDDNSVLYPCAALSVLRILQAYHRTPVPNSWKGVTVTIVNRSEIFGRPLAALLANAGATVYSVDVDSVLLFRDGGRMRRCSDSSKTLEKCLSKSSVVVSGVPSPDFCIPSEWINPGTTVVNVSEYPNLCEGSLLDVPGVQYIPQVGKVTIAVLEQNLIELHRRYGNGNQ